MEDLEHRSPCCSICILPHCEFFRFLVLLSIFGRKASRATATTTRLRTRCLARVKSERGKLLEQLRGTSGEQFTNLCRGFVQSIYSSEVCAFCSLPFSHKIICSPFSSDLESCFFFSLFVVSCLNFFCFSHFPFP